MDECLRFLETQSQLLASQSLTAFPQSKPFEPSDLKKKILELTKSIKPTLKALDHQSLKNKLQSNNPDNKAFHSDKDGLPSQNSEEIIIDTTVTGPKINLSYLKRISEGNDNFVIEMIEMFLNKTPIALEQMNQCFLKQNWKELRNIIHRIKPSFAYVGMQEIQTKLTSIESWNDEMEDKKIVGALMREIETGSRNAFDQLREELISMK